MLFFYGILLYWCLAGTMYSVQECAFSIASTMSDQDVKKVVDESFSHSCTVRDVRYTCDSVMQPEEFFYLFTVQKQKPLEKDALAGGLLLLKKKNKFQTMGVRILPVDDDEVIVDVDLKSLWTFGGVSIKGMRHTAHLLHLYMQKVGDPFHEEMHDHSLQAITQALHDQGLCNVTVDAVRAYYDERKEMRVTVTINPGSSFIITNAQSSVVPTQPSIPESTIHALEDAIENNVCVLFSRVAYNVRAVHDGTKAIEELLKKYPMIIGTVSVACQIHHDENTVDVAWNVSLKPKKECIFMGNTAYSYDELAQHVSLFGDQIWALSPSLIARELELWYHERGFLDAHVTGEKRDTGYVCTVSEGCAYVINTVTIQGVCDDDFLRHIHSLVSVPHETGIVDRDVINKKIHAVRSWYQDQGFLDSTVTYRLEKMPYSAHMNLILQVHEGARYVCTQITCEGVDESIVPCSGDAVQKDAQGRPYYTSTLVERVRATILHPASAHTITYDTLTYIPCRIPETHEIHLVWSTVPAQKQRCFGKTVIAGSTPVPFESLMGFLPYKEGDPFNPALLQRASRLLKNTNAFDTVSLTQHYSDSGTNEVPIVLRLHEDAPYEVRMRGGVQMQSMPQGSFPFVAVWKGSVLGRIKNPLSVADTGLVEFSCGPGAYTMRCAYHRPWIGMYPIQTTMQAYGTFDSPKMLMRHKPSFHSVAKYGISAKGVREYKQVVLESTVGVERVEMNRFEKHSFNHEQQGRLAQALGLDKLTEHFSDTQCYAEQTVFFDHSLNDRLNPKEGRYALVKVRPIFSLHRQGVTPYSMLVYGEQGMFMPFGSTLWSVRMSAGTVLYRSFGDLLPAERLYAGGAKSLRAYEKDMVPPLVVCNGDNGKDYLVPCGGKSLVSLAGECRFPVYGPVQGVVFHDMAWVSKDKIYHIAMHDVIHGTGLGACIDTPLGPLRLDVGFKWHREHPSERPYAWSLSMGQVF